jgi:DHA1 family bicyclomycin/chloramphenicol resistance-like MFS transporter
MLGFLQIGVSVVASATIGIFDSHTMMPVALVMAVTSWIALAVLTVGKRRIRQLRYVEEKDANFLSH